MFKIGIDIMSGERPPDELIKGCLRALDLYKAELYLVGNKTLIERHTRHVNKNKKKRLHTIHAESIIGMDETPSKACRKKKDASVVVGCEHLKQGTYDSFFSPGNTGATLTAALLNVGRIKGVKRPAITTPIPNAKGKYSYILDMGANTDCTWRYLKQFAIMGNVFYKNFYHCPAPTVGLLNIGTEEGKGNELTLRTHRELSKIPFNFIGNVEPEDVFEGNCDVTVCDGFVGNIFLKSAEACTKQFSRIVKSGIQQQFKAKMGAFLMRDIFKTLKSKLDSNSYGAAPLLGVNKPVFIGHGSTNSEGIANVIKTCIDAIDAKIIQQTEKEIIHYS